MTTNVTGYSAISRLMDDEWKKDEKQNGIQCMIKEGYAPILIPDTGDFLDFKTVTRIFATAGIPYSYN